MLSKSTVSEPPVASGGPAARSVRVVETAGEASRLLADLGCGGQPAIDELSYRYRARIVRLATRYLRDVSEAEDLAQEVLLKVWRNVSQFRGEAQLWPWIERITANTSISHLRARRRRPVEPLTPADDTTTASSRTPDPSDGRLLADDEVMLAQFRERAALALQRLPANYRNAVVLMDLHQCSTQEASRWLGIPVPTVKSRAIRGRRLLRHSLAAFAGGLGLRVPVA
jgi:RNA polymerase sigma-70 factor (ECF subfamily)